MKRLAERVPDHRPNVALSAVGSVWPFVAGLVIA